MVGLHMNCVCFGWLVQEIWQEVTFPNTSTGQSVRISVMFLP